MKTIHVIDKEGKEYMKINYVFNMEKITDNGFFINDISFTSIDTMTSSPEVLDIMLCIERMLKDEAFLRMSTCRQISVHHVMRTNDETQGDGLMIHLQKFIESKCESMEIDNDRFKVVTDYYYNRLKRPNIHGSQQLNEEGILKLLRTISETLKDLSNEINKFIKENE